MSTVFRVTLEGEQEVGPTGSAASGVGTVIFDSAAIAANYSFVIQGVDYGLASGGTPQTADTGDDVTSTHFHSQVRGVNGPVIFGQIGPAHDADDLEIELNADGSWSLSGRWETTDTPSITNFSPLLNATFADVLGSATIGSDVPIYFNVHTSDHLTGEIRGQLVAISDDIDNVLTGTEDPDSLGGGKKGNDAIQGLAGDDVLDGGNGDDVLDGGADDDVLKGGNGDDFLDGSFGDDSLGGNNGEDVLYGGAGDDELDGGNGRDTVNGGAGDDVLTGGNGPDLFVFEAGFGNDIIADFGSSDTIRFEDGLFVSPEAALAASHQVGDDVVITAGTNAVTLLDVQASSLHADDFMTVA